MRRFYGLFLAALGCYGQIHDIATTDDGGQVYFVSAQRLKGTDLVDTDKIFRYVNGGVELFEYSPKTVLQGIPSFSCCSLDWPEISGDGRVVGFTSARRCIGGSSCLGANYYPLYTGRIRGTVERTLGDGRVRLSSNGRYVLQFDPNPPFRGANPVLSDLVSGSDTVLSGFSSMGDARQTVASDGTVLLDSNNVAILWKAGAVRSLGFSTPMLARMDNGASVIVQESGVVPRFLIAVDVASGRQTNLAQARDSVSANSAFFRPSLSYDGTLVAYLDKASDGAIQAYVQNTDGSNKRALTAEARGVSEVALSGFGNVAYAVGDAGRLIRIDLATSAVTEIVKPAPDLGNPPIVPGGLFVVAKWVLPQETTGITVNGRAAPLVGSKPGFLTFQTPWETELDVAPVVTASGFGTPFENAVPPTVYSIAPDFYFLGRLTGGYVLAAHEDFSGLVTTSNPAKAGEVVHLFLTGLGQVSPPVATGVVTPSDTLHRATANITCNFEVLFAGLAPGFIGLNQMDVRLPSPLPTTDPVLICKAPDSNCAGCPVGTAMIAAR